VTIDHLRISDFDSTLFIGVVSLKVDKRITIYANFNESIMYFHIKS